MAKTAHSTTAPATAQPGFIDPPTLPAEYAMRVRGDCLAPAIKGGDSVLVDQRQPYAAGDLVCVFLKPECVAPGRTNVGLKRLVLNMMPGITYPYRASPDSNIMPVLIAEQDNPTMQYTIPADQILAIHRCMGLVPDDVALYDPTTGEPEYRRAVSAGWSRRDLLAGAISIAPVAGIVSLPALAVDGPDPIFAAIEAHRAAVLAFDAAVEVEFRLEEELPMEACQSNVTAWQHVIVETDDPRWIAAIEARKETCEVADDMAWDLIEQTPPITAAGAAALLAYADDALEERLREGWFPDNWLEAAYRAIALTSIRLAGGAS